MAKSFDYDVELDELILIDRDKIEVDNLRSIRRSIEKMQLIIDDINRRLEELE